MVSADSAILWAVERHDDSSPPRDLRESSSSFGSSGGPGRFGPGGCWTEAKRFCEIPVGPSRAVIEAGMEALSERKDCCVATLYFVATENKRNERREAIVPDETDGVCAVIAGSNHNTHLPQDQLIYSRTARFVESLKKR